jgi:hypothetical protein
MIATDKDWRPFEPSCDAAEDAEAARRDLEWAAVVDAVVGQIRAALMQYTFTPQHEADLQEQVTAVMFKAGMVVDREVIAERGRYDLLVRRNFVRVVLELKVSGSAPAVERQAQRYALTEGIDAVAVVTTSSRLARELQRTEGDALGGKPFAVMALRGF